MTLQMFSTFGTIADSDRIGAQPRQGPQVPVRRVYTARNIILWRSRICLHTKTSMPLHPSQHQGVDNLNLHVPNTYSVLISSAVLRQISLLPSHPYPGIPGLVCPQWLAFSSSWSGLFIWPRTASRAEKRPGDISTQIFRILWSFVRRKKR